MVFGYFGMNVDGLRGRDGAEEMLTWPMFLWVWLLCGVLWAPHDDSAAVQGARDAGVLSGEYHQEWFSAAGGKVLPGWVFDNGALFLWSIELSLRTTEETMDELNSIGAGVSGCMEWSARREARRTQGVVTR